MLRIAPGRDYRAGLPLVWVRDSGTSRTACQALAISAEQQYRSNQSERSRSGQEAVNARQNAGRGEGRHVDAAALHEARIGSGPTGEDQQALGDGRVVGHLGAGVGEDAEGARHVDRGQVDRVDRFRQLTG